MSIFAKMKGLALGLLLGLSVAEGAAAQDFSGLARLDVAQSQVRDTRRGLEVALYLSQPVPFRVFTLEAPRRLVVDFREVDWRGASRAGLLNADRASDLRFGALRPGWSRLVVDLAAPLVIEEAGMRVDAVTGTADLLVRLVPAGAAEFAAASGPPPESGVWAELMAADPAVPPLPEGAEDTLIVAIDPGHGGIDPGARRDGIEEADLMLALGLELAEALTRAGGITPVLTRREDVFVPLEERMTIARAAGADVLLSLHADALEMDAAQGASVYLLSERGLDRASERVAERHDRGDLLAGLDLSGQDDTVATVLMDLARLETAPQAGRLREALIGGFEDTGARLNSRPRRSAVLAVLSAADFPSVLVEVGFLSNAEDRAALSTRDGRAPVVAGLVLGLQRWAAEEEALAPLIRQ